MNTKGKVQLFFNHLIEQSDERDLTELLQESGAIELHLISTATNVDPNLYNFTWEAEVG